MGFRDAVEGCGMLRGESMSLGIGDLFDRKLGFVDA